MLTARAEYRLRLRASNAATRLTPIAVDIGCVGRDRAAWFSKREDRRSTWNAALDQVVRPDAIDASTRGGAAKPLREWLGRGSDGLATLLPAGFYADDLGTELVEDATYAPYLARQEAELRDLRSSESVAIPSSFAYERVPGLSREMVERLSNARPRTLAAAGRVAGVTPAALAALLVHVRRAEAA
jgi:tRNA uridine 5-carboxymethylaminomethyl modification enzyme